jgi:hypothetical protein
MDPYERRSDEQLLAATRHWTARSRRIDTHLLEKGRAIEERRSLDEAIRGRIEDGSLDPKENRVEREPTAEVHRQAEAGDRPGNLLEHSASM